MAQNINTNYLPELRWLINTHFSGLQINPQNTYFEKNKAIIEPNGRMRIKIDLDLARKEYASALFKSIERTLYHPDAITALTIHEDKNEKSPFFGLDISKLPADDIKLLEKLDGDLKSVARTPGYVLVFKARSGRVDYKNFDVVHISDLEEYFQPPGTSYRPLSKIFKSAKREHRVNLVDDSPVGDDFDVESVVDIENLSYGNGYIVRPKD